jgi:hypothetical protein
VKEKYGIRGREMAPMGAHFIAFSAQTRLSGIDLDGSVIRKGAVDAVLAFVREAADKSYSGEGVALAAGFRPGVADATVRELNAKSGVIATSGGTHAPSGLGRSASVFPCALPPNRSTYHGESAPATASRRANSGTRPG